MTPGEVAQRLVEALVGRAREDRGHDEVAGHDVGDPGAGRRAGVLPDAAEGDDHGQADGQRPDRQRRAAAVAQDRGPGEALLEPGDERERGARPPGRGRAGRTARTARRAGAWRRRRARERARRRRPSAARRTGRPRRPCAKTATSQRRRARRALGRSIRALSASTGGMRPARRAGLQGRREGHGEPDREGGEGALGGDARVPAAARRRPSRPRRAMTAARTAPSSTPISGPDDADGQGLDEDERGQLAAGRAGRAQQAELADPLDDGHRERVEDEERAREQGDRRDERGRGREVTGRGAHRGPEVARRREHVRLGEQRRLEGVRDRP